MREVEREDVALVRPCIDRLDQYADALRRGWSPDTFTPEATARRQLEEIERDPAGFLAVQDDPEALGPPIVQPDGSQSRRLPGFHRWIFDGGFVGDISIRWAPGTPELPAAVLGHIGYSVVPWARGRGVATRALGLLLDDVRNAPHPTMRLPHLEITTNVENAASQRVITHNGGVLVEEFVTNAAHGARPSLRFRIDL